MAGTLPRAFAVRPDRRDGAIELGNFRILGRLGEGGFAEAFLAEQVGTERRAVVKIAHARLMRGDDAAQLRERFHDEARASTRVQHASLATVYTCGDTSDGLPAIAMEFVPGVVLDTYLTARAPLRLKEFGYFKQLTSALAAIHRHGIVHRDVTPKNIVLGRDHSGKARAKLLDFGIAQLPTAEPVPHAAMFGAPHYVAPEQLRGHAVCASDLFSLGAILWWALTGVSYLAELPSMGKVLRHQMSAPMPADPREIRPDVPPEWARMVRRLLHPDPQSRPTAADLLAAWPATTSSPLRTDAASSQQVLPQTLSKAAPAPSLQALPQATQQPNTKPSSQLERSEGMRVLVIEPNEVVRRTVENYLNRLGCIVTCAAHPRQATRGTAGSQDIIAISVRLRRLRIDSVMAHLREHFPKQKVVLLYTDDRKDTWAKLNADLLTRVPDELAGLGAFVEQVGQLEAPSHGQLLGTADTKPMWKRSPKQSAEMFVGTVDRFLGEMPEWIAELDETVKEGLSARGLEACRNIQRAAESLGQKRLALLAATFEMLADAGELIDPTSYIHDIEMEYQRVFQTLMKKREAAQSRRERTAS